MTNLKSERMRQYEAYAEGIITKDKYFAYEAAALQIKSTAMRQKWKDLLTYQ